MNSVLQQLYMIPLFRKTLIEIEENHENEDENILLPLKVNKKN